MDAHRPRQRSTLWPVGAAGDTDRGHTAALEGYVVQSAAPGARRARRTILQRGERRASSRAELHLPSGCRAAVCNAGSRDHQSRRRALAARRQHDRAAQRGGRPEYTVSCRAVLVALPARLFQPESGAAGAGAHADRIADGLVSVALPGAQQLRLVCAARWRTRSRRRAAQQRRRPGGRHRVQRQEPPPSLGARGHHLAGQHGRRAGPRASARCRV